jgi:Guanylate kinase
MSTKANMDEFLLLILSSPSGAKKTTLCEKLRTNLPRLHFNISHTTHKPRPNELDDHEYHFVDQPRFETIMTDGTFAE